MKPMLLRDYIGQDVSGWLMSEKLDGWRVLWDGESFVSRELGKLHAPEWFKSGMPSAPLDGELFAGRGNFNFIQAMMRDGWVGLIYCVFDLPNDERDYASRLKTLRLYPLPNHCSLVQQTKIKSHFDVLAGGDSAVNLGGEGVVVRNPNGFYEYGQRTWNALKWVPQDPAINRKSSGIARVA